MNTPEIVVNFEDETPQGTRFVTELPELVFLLQAWHERQVKTVEHFLDVPEGQAVRIEDGEELILQGDGLRGYKLGLSIALFYLGHLPFSPAMEEVSNETTL